MWSERKAIRVIVNFFLLAIKKHCKINPLLSTFSGGGLVSSRLRALVCVKWRLF